MNGTITKKLRKSGEPSWGYSFFAGRDGAGKRLQFTKSGFGTKREAGEALRRAIAVHDAGAAVAKDSRTFAAFFEEWMREVAGRRCQPKTIERYGQLGAYAVRKFGAIEIQKLQSMTIEKAVNELQDRGGRIDKDHPQGRPLAVKTVRNIAFIVHGCLQTALRWGLLRVNPMDRVELPKPVKNEPRILDREGIYILFKAAAGTRLFALIVLAAATGCRRGELLALTWTDIDFESGAVNISKSLEETKAGLRVKSTKSNKPRRFGIPGQALLVLEEHRSRQEQDRALFGSDYDDRNLVFCRPEGGYYTPDKVSVRVTELATKAGLPGVGLHTLRHSHASELLSKGAPIPTVAKRLGHANASVTLSIYSHALEADELAAAKIWNDAMADVIQANRNTRRELMLADVSLKDSEDCTSSRKKMG